MLLGETRDPVRGDSVAPVLDAKRSNTLHVGDVVGDHRRVQRKRVSGDRDIEVLEADAATLEVS